MSDLLAHPLVIQIIIAVLGVELLNTFAADQLAAVLRRVPLIGGLLARVARSLSPSAIKWMKEQVRRSAEDAVKQQEPEAMPNLEKKRRAVKQLQEDEPGLTKQAADQEIENALKRLKADRVRTSK